MLIANISHELRTPLALVLGYAELLATRELPPAAAGLAADLLAGAQRLAAIVGDIVLAADLEGGQVRLAPARVELAPLLERWAAAGPAAHPVRLELQADLPAVRADPTALLQLLDRLRANVAQHAPASSAIVVTARLAPDAVWLLVSDAGPGMPPEELPRVFEPFFRSSPTRERLLPGLGLGLTIVRRLVELQGGQVAAVNRPGGGTTIAFSLPRA
jgi:signal transduction histidine kinase